MDRAPRWKQGEGPSAKSAKFFIRSFEPDAHVQAVPGDAEVSAVQDEFPDAPIHIIPRPGQRLSDLPEQEPYRYELAHVFLGADDHDDLFEKFDRVRQKLTFDLAPV